MGYDRDLLMAGAPSFSEELNTLSERLTSRGINFIHGQSQELTVVT